MQEQLPVILSRIPYDPGEVILIGSTISDGGQPAVAQIRFNLDGDAGSHVRAELKDADEKHQIALVRGYCFEGHYYDMPKPKVMVVTGPATDLPVDTIPADTALKFWRMSRQARSAVITVDDGLLEDLVLTANLPGRGAADSYAANMQLAHRSGRLSS